MGALDNNRVQGDADVSGVVTARSVQEALARVTVSTMFQIPTRSHGTYEITASPSNDIIRLPNASLLPDGWTVKILNTAASIVNLIVENFAGVPLIELLPGEYFEFQLLDGSAPSGSWYSIFMQESDQSSMPALPCDPAVVVGDAVYVNASGVLQKATASATFVEAKSVGFVVAKPASAKARVAQWGIAVVSGGVTPGADIYLSPTVPGGFTNGLTSTSGQFIKYLGKGLTATTILVDSSPRPVLRS